QPALDRGRGARHRRAAGVGVGLRSEEGARGLRPHSRGDRDRPGLRPLLDRSGRDRLGGADPPGGAPGGRPRAGDPPAAPRGGGEDLDRAALRRRRDRPSAQRSDAPGDFGAARESPADRGAARSPDRERDGLAGDLEAGRGEPPLGRSSRHPPRDLPQPAFPARGRPAAPARSPQGRAARPRRRPAPRATAAPPRAAPLGPAGLGSVLRRFDGDSAPDLTPWEPARRVGHRVSDQAFKRRRIPQRGVEPELPSPAEPRQRGQEGTSAGKRDPQRAHPLDRPADSESTSFGSWLRRQREAREVSLREIADRTKISMRYLEAMEEDRYDLLPAPVFARGFLREYARYVGLNADEVINHFLAAQQTQSAGSDDAPASGPALSIPRSGSSPWPRLLFFGLATLILLGLVALGVWLADRRRARPQSAPPPPIAAPPVSASPAVTPSSPAAPESPARALRLTL